MHLDPDEYTHFKRLVNKRRRAHRRLLNVKAKNRGRDMRLADKLAMFRPHSEAIQELNAEIDNVLYRRVA